MVIIWVYLTFLCIFISIVAKKPLLINSCKLKHSAQWHRIDQLLCIYIIWFSCTCLIPVQALAQVSCRCSGHILFRMQVVRTGGAGTALSESSEFWGVLLGVHSQCRWSLKRLLPLPFSGMTWMGCCCHLCFLVLCIPGFPKITRFYKAQLLGSG